MSNVEHSFKEAGSVMNLLVDTEKFSHTSHDTKEDPAQMPRSRREAFELQIENRKPLFNYISKVYKNVRFLTFSFSKY